MPITIFQGDTGRLLRFPLSYSDGSKPNLQGFTNANFVLHLWNGTTTVVCAGDFSIQTAADGTFSVVAYQPLTSEVNTPGTWTVYLTVVFATGPVTWPTDTITITTTH